VRGIGACSGNSPSALGPVSWRKSDASCVADGHRPGTQAPLGSAVVGSATVPASCLAWSPPSVTHGELLHWHPHLHVLLACGAFTPAGDFVELTELDLDRLEVAWQEAVFALYLAPFSWAEDKIQPEVVENMRSWEHSGQSVDQSVLLPAGDQAHDRTPSAVHDPVSARVWLDW